MILQQTPKLTPKKNALCFTLFTYPRQKVVSCSHCYFDSFFLRLTRNTAEILSVLELQQKGQQKSLKLKACKCASCLDRALRMSERPRQKCYRILDFRWKKPCCQLKLLSETSVNMNKFSLVKITQNYLNTSHSAILERVSIILLNLTSCAKHSSSGYLFILLSYEDAWNDLRGSEIIGNFTGLFITNRYLRINVVKREWP